MGSVSSHPRHPRSPDRPARRRTRVAGHGPPGNGLCPGNESRSLSDAGLFEIAAAYAFGIAKAHAFVDGNKRTAFVTAVTFLRLNSLLFRPDPAQGLRMMESLATGNVTETDFASWLQEGSSRV